jgi:hypothetical protein
MNSERNRQRGLVVLAKIDEILDWEKQVGDQKDARFLELGRYLCEVRSGQYWRLEQLKSFDEFLDRRFPESKRKAYYLMSIHEALPPNAEDELSEVGWAKAVELVRVARSDGEKFDCATWLHKAKKLPKQEFQQEVHRHLHGPDQERWEILHFKLYASQVLVVDQAVHMAGLMIGSRSRGHALEMICADFIGEVGIETENPELMLYAIHRLIAVLPAPQRDVLIDTLQTAASERTEDHPGFAPTLETHTMGPFVSDSRTSQ